MNTTILHCFHEFQETYEKQLAAAGGRCRMRMTAEQGGEGGLEGGGGVMLFLRMGARPAASKGKTALGPSLPWTCSGSYDEGGCKQRCARLHVAALLLLLCWRRTCRPAILEDLKCYD